MQLGSLPHDAKRKYEADSSREPSNDAVRTKFVFNEIDPDLIQLFHNPSLSYYLGLRPGAVELLSLTWDQVNWQENHIRVFSAHKGGPVSWNMPIHGDFLPILTKWFLKDNNKG
jgi:integrase